MATFKTEAEYAQDLITMGVDETEAHETAHILRQVDGKRPRTPKEQALVTKIYQQMQRSLVSRGLPVPFITN